MRHFILAVPLALLWLVTAAVPQAGAYEQWSTNGGSSPTGYCSDCHGDFNSGTYTSNKDGTSWGNTLMNGHSNFIGSGSCNVCHWGTGDNRFPVFLNSSLGTTGFDPISCVGCHGRDEDLNNGQIGAGLRQHHWNAGVQECAECHDDADPSVFTTVGEDVQPRYYKTDVTSRPNMPTNPCDIPPGNEAKFGPTGLDNDGDLLDDGDDSDCAAGAPDIALNPTSLGFGTVFIGDTNTLTTQIQNVGTADLTVTGIALATGTSTEFGFTAPATPFVVSASGSQSVTVTYSPADLGADNGSIEITSDDPDEPTVSLAVSGTGEAVPVADINLAPAALNFGTVTTGNTATLSTQIQNVGTANLEVSGVTACAGTSTEFAFTDPGPLTILPGGAQTLSVDYSPTDTGPDTGCLEVASNDPDENPAVLNLAGSGAAPLVCDIDVSPLVLDFGSILEGTSSTLNTSVGNVGTADCIVNSLVVSGDPEFTLGAGAPGLPFTVTPGGTPVDVPVTYSPPAAGSHTGTLSIGSNDPVDPTVAVDLAGAANATPQPDINLNPVALDFGVVTVGDTATLSSQVQNLGTADLVVSLVNLCAGTSTEFSFVPLASMTIAPSGSETLSVTYTPGDAGTDTGCIAIDSNDPDEATVELGLSGTGEVPPVDVPDINLNPVALDFGVVTVGGTATLTSQIENLGTADLTVNSIAPTAGTSVEFSFTAPATPFVIPVGGSQSVTVTFGPADVGPETGSLEILSDDPDEPAVELALSGSGEPVPVPDIALNPTDLAFGNVLIGNSKTLSSEVQNLGTGDLEILAVNLCAGTSVEFSFAPLGSSIIPPGGAQTLSVTYMPTDLGDDVGCLEIASNDPDEESVQLGVTGTGIEQPTSVEVGVKVPGAINPKNNGVTPVKFYADMDLEFEAVFCGPNEAEPERLNSEDFNDDGFQDVVGLFRTKALGIECGDEVLVCHGTLADGTEFTGTSNTFKTVGRECRKSDAWAKKSHRFSRDDDRHGSEDQEGKNNDNKDGKNSNDDNNGPHLTSWWYGSGGRDR